MSHQRPAVDPHHGEAQPIGRPAGRGGVHAGGHRHLLERGRAEDVAGVPEQEDGEPGEVGRRRPQLPGRGHDARVVLRLRQDDVGPRVHRRAGCRGRPRARRRPVHAEGTEHLGSDDVLPGGAALPRHQLTEQAEAQVGVVEPAGGPQDDVGGAEAELVERAARRALPPAARALRDGAGEVRQQLPDGAVAQRRARQVLLQRVVERQPALVAQSHHDGRGNRLADRPEPVLHVGVRLRHVAAPGRPGEPAVAHHAGDQAGRAAVALRAGGAGQEPAGGGRQDGRHGRTVVSRPRGGPVSRRGRAPALAAGRRGWPAARTTPWPAAGRRRPAPAAWCAPASAAPGRRAG